MVVAARPRPAAEVAAPPRPRVVSGPIQITVDQDELVASFMDIDALLAEGMSAEGAVLSQVLRRLPAGPVKHDLQIAIHDLHERLVKARVEARMGTARYETSPRRTRD